MSWTAINMRTPQMFAPFLEDLYPLSKLQARHKQITRKEHPAGPFNLTTFTIKEFSVDLPSPVWRTGDITALFFFAVNQKGDAFAPPDLSKMVLLPKSWANDFRADEQAKENTVFYYNKSSSLALPDGKYESTVGKVIPETFIKMLANNYASLVHRDNKATQPGRVITLFREKEGKKKFVQVEKIHFCVHILSRKNPVIPIPNETALDVHKQKITDTTLRGTFSTFDLQKKKIVIAAYARETSAYMLPEITQLIAKMLFSKGYIVRITEQTIKRKNAESISSFCEKLPHIRSSSLLKENLLRKNTLIFRRSL